MANNKNRRPQTPKVKSPEAKALTLSRRGGVGDRIPSATAYKRTVKHRNQGWE
jgi:hypothetical protein